MRAKEGARICRQSQSDHNSMLQAAVCSVLRVTGAIYIFIHFTFTFQIILGGKVRNFCGMATQTFMQIHIVPVQIS